MEPRLEPATSAEGSKCLIKSNLKLSPDNPLRPLTSLLSFLNFAKGCNCGFGHLFAYDADDAVAFKLLGFSPSDLERREINWYDIQIQKSLPEIFMLFSEASTDELTRRALNQTINFYRASNASRRVSIEMSIIAAHSALEAIVHYILGYRAGWSKPLMKNRTIAFADKSRAATLHFGIEGDLLSMSPELSKFSSENSNIDVFEIISQFRNRLVHQDTKGALSGIQLHESWLISQWLVEVLVFGVIGYRGTIIDRRAYGEWRGTTCQVPLSR